MMWPMAYLWVVALGSGFLSGLVEAPWTDARIDQDDRRKLPHKLLWGIRIALSVVGAWLCTGHVWPHAMALFAALCAAHRTTYNALREPLSIKWWHMGPDLHSRKKDDSFYDGIYHNVANVLYILSNNAPPRWLPFILATLTELAVAVYFTINP